MVTECLLVAAWQWPETWQQLDMVPQWPALSAALQLLEAGHGGAGGNLFNLAQLTFGSVAALFTDCMSQHGQAVWLCTAARRCMGETPRHGPAARPRSVVGRSPEDTSRHEQAAQPCSAKVLSCAPGAASTPPAASPGALSSLLASVGGARSVPTVVLALFSVFNCFSESTRSLQGFITLMAVSSPMEAASIIILPARSHFFKSRAVPSERSSLWLLHHVIKAVKDCLSYFIPFFVKKKFIPEVRGLLVLKPLHPCWQCLPLRKKEKEKT